MLNVKLKLKEKKSFPSKSSPYDILLSLNENPKEKVIAAKINDEQWDLHRSLPDGDYELDFITWDDLEGKNIFWHSSAHIMAEAIQYYFPKAKFAIGPPVENGFYYDLDFEENVPSAEDYKKIEKKFLKIASQNFKFQRTEISKQEAINFFTENYNPYKLEILKNLEDGKITFYKQGNFTDLCRGIHLPSTNFIKSFKITNIAGAYWKGDSKNKQLTRIYGISFPSKEELDSYLFNLEEAKKRDHKKIGKDLKIYTFSQKVGIGLPLWLPNGAIIRQKIIDFFYKDQLENGYLPVVTPHIGRKDLYVTSGHYDKYSEDSFQTIKVPNEKDEYMLKPMNCPHHCEIYKSEMRSYRDLPLRLFEFGTVYRYEQHGEINGLTRTRSFTQDDAHIFCTKDQISQEIFNIILRVQKTFKALSFEEYSVRVSTRDKKNLSKYIGDNEEWEIAETSILESIKSANIPYEEGEGEAAFYGPKLDFLVKDSLGRKWQLGTIQLDYQLPKRFELSYISSKNTKETPVMIHRAPMGSLERLIAILIEHTAGILPFWLCPLQIKIIPVISSDDLKNYASTVFQKLKEKNFSCEIDFSSEKLGKKILNAEMQKIPLIIVLGENEKNNQEISLRKKGEAQHTTMSLNDFLENSNDIV